MKKFKELKNQKDIEVKFHRLTFPTLNTLDLPLSGLYNPINNKESTDFLLSNQLYNFDITQNNSPNINNFFTYNSTYKEIFINEIFEGLIVFLNTSDHEIILKNIKITKQPNDNNVMEPIDVQISDNPIIITPNNSYSLKLCFKINHTGTNRIHIYMNKKSSAYDREYNKIKQKYHVKENTEQYSIINGSPEFFYKKKVKFEALNPFKITEKFHFFQNTRSLIEIKIYNDTNLFPLTLLDVFLTPQTNKNIKIPLIQKLEEIKGNKFSQNINDSKYITIEPEEEIGLLYKIDNSELYFDEQKFILNIKWLKIYDFNIKLYTYEFNNDLKLHNKYFQIIINDKPKDDITLNQTFQIVINIKSKNLDEKYTIKITKLINYSSSAINDKEIEIIDIIDKNIQLNNKMPSACFVLICKSNNLGKVYLPKLKLSLYEKNKTTPIEYIYKQLLSFNCVPIKKIDITI